VHFSRRFSGCSFRAAIRRYSPDFGGVGTRTVHANATGPNGQPFSGGVTVGPYSIVVLSQDKPPPAR
jgi:hypothetical protein